MLRTTWNTVCNAVANLPGNWDGLEPVAEDFPVVLRRLVDFPGWLEVETPSSRDEYGFDTCYVLPDGRATSLEDWIPADEWPEGASNREGIAVPEEIARLVSPPCPPRRQFWRHRRSGEVWAVELEAGMVVRACGPLHYSERDIESLEFSSEDAEWLNSRVDEFVIHE